ncbi:MAG TPA: rhamnan synthesis F family protein, partial [Chthoniobacterales bacterium]
MAALRALDFAIIFVTTADLDEQAIASVRPLCANVICRENKGHDFGSWAAAHAKYGDQVHGLLLLANDSVYGPIGDLGAVVTQLLSQDADFFGLVESVDMAPHLQSWFLLFKPCAHRSEAFRSIWRLPFADLSKRDIIERAEIGLSTALTQAGFRYRAAFPASRLGWLGRRHRCNLTHSLWRHLVQFGEVPFIKVELLRDNPIGVPDIREWRAVAGQI